MTDRSFSFTKYTGEPAWTAVEDTHDSFHIIQHVFDNCTGTYPTMLLVNLR